MGFSKGGIHERKNNAQQKVGNQIDHTYVYVYRPMCIRNNYACTHQLGLLIDG